MRHRFVNFYTGLGNPDEILLNNEMPETKSENFKKVFEEMASEAINNFKTLSRVGGLDYTITDDYIRIGYEPAYMYEPFLLIVFDFKNKNNSSVSTGTAWGAYGSNIVSKTKLYKDYKKRTKFVKLIDEWYDKLNIN